MEPNGFVEVKYTESAQKRLDELTNEYIKRLEHHLRRRKFRKGKNYIEVTTSDLESVASNYKYVRKSEGSEVLRLYTIFSIGIMVMLAGGLWKLYEYIVPKGGDFNNNLFALAIVFGTILIAISISVFFYKKLVESEKKKERDRRHGIK